MKYKKTNFRPKLRFPEFTNDWEEKKLEEISQKPMYGMNAASKKFDGENAYLRITDIDESTHRFNRKGLTSPSGDLDDDFLLNEGDLLFTRTGASTGKTYLYESSDGKVYFAGFLIRFRITKANAYFVFCQTLTHKYNKWVNTVSMRSGQPGVNSNEYASFKLCLPSIEEQEKIAEFLSSADEWINNLKSQKEALEKYKKGMMQKIFSHEIRFKDENGNDYLEWDSRRLDEVATFRRGSFPQPYGLAKWYDETSGIPFVQVFDVGENMKLKDRTKQKISDLAKPMSVFVEKGNIVLTIQGSIGRIALTQYDAYVDRTLLIFKSFKIPMDKKYFVYVVQILFELEKRKAPGGTIKTITKDALSSFILNLPILAEQQKIASFLSTIDDMIDAKEKQIMQAESWKKGLMQGLFI